MTRLVFATGNRGKVAELRQLLADVGDIEILSGSEIDLPEVIEDGDTFTANAVKKAMEVSRHTGLPALADDSGLEVDALDGAPGVYSARFAGPNATDADNNRKLLDQLTGVPGEGRTARFRSVLALADCHGALGSRVITSEGMCEGLILDEPRGTGGFGYDPLFFCPELGMTFAEAGIGPKGDLSHRARAMKSMKPRLRNYFETNHG